MVKVTESDKGLKISVSLIKTSHPETLNTFNDNN